jgi:putative endonuclease
MKNFCVYILRSNKNGRYYVGSTDDMERRLIEHNNGRVLSTKNTRPFQLKAYICCSSLSEAKSCEYRLKKYKRKDILEKVIKDKIFPWNH